MRRLGVSFALFIGTAVAVHAADRITPTCDPNRVPSCWVEHGDSTGPQLVPVEPEQYDLSPPVAPPTALAPPGYHAPPPSSALGEHLLPPSSLCSTRLRSGRIGRADQGFSCRVGPDLWQKACWAALIRMLRWWPRQQACADRLGRAATRTSRCPDEIVVFSHRARRFASRKKREGLTVDRCPGTLIKKWRYWPRGLGGRFPQILHDIFDEASTDFCKSLCPSTSRRLIFSFVSSAKRSW